jgi:Mrp family chromosome partitioning ATPase
MALLLVTIIGPSGRRDLAVPADVPIGDLLAPLAAAGPSGGDAPPPGAAWWAGWRLGAVGGDPLPVERSLAACGVGDGAVLELMPDPPPAAGPTPGRRRGAVVGVVSAVAGVGRTTVAALLACALAATREGLTVAVDTHPRPGSLSELLAADHDVAAADLLALLDHPALTGEELVACLAGGRPGPAVVVAAAARGSPAPAPVTPGVHGPGGAPLDRRALARLVAGLAGHAGALVLDGGPGLGDPATRVAVATADQLVLVTEPEPSPASRRLAGTLVELGHAVVAAAWRPRPSAARRRLPPAGATRPPPRLERRRAGGLGAAAARGTGGRAAAAAPRRGRRGRPGRGAAPLGGGAALVAWPRAPARRAARGRLARPRHRDGGLQTRRPGGPNSLPLPEVSAILQRVDVWPSGREPVRSEVGIAPTSVL